MGFSPDLSITGGAQTGLTSPTYTMVSDIPANNDQYQWAVSALGGTQTNVRTHTRGDPFTISIRRLPYKQLPNANPATGSYPNVPLNRIEFTFKKGVKIDAAGTIRVMNLRLSAEIPAGAESNDSINILAATSFFVGLFNEESSDLGQTLVTGLVG